MKFNQVYWQKLFWRIGKVSSKYIPFGPDVSQPTSSAQTYFKINCDGTEWEKANIMFLVVLLLKQGSLSWMFLCVECEHSLWDPIDTLLGHNWLANQNVGFQSHDSKKQEYGGHFVVSCDAMLISISCYELYLSVHMRSTLWVFNC